MFDLLKGRKIPSRELHFNRNSFNRVPKTNIYCTNTLNKRKLRIFKEVVIKNGKEIEIEWHEQPWYLNIFHNPAVNIKLLSYDEYDGSREVFVKKKNINNVDSDNCVYYISPTLLTEGSYNFRDYDVTSHWKHFLADVLPVAIYCKCMSA